VGIYARYNDSIAICLDTRGNNMVDDMEHVLQEPLKLIVVHGGELL
jgi:translation initiation factor 6 (eIF-6)